MNNPVAGVKSDREAPQTCSEIELMIQSKETDLGGFSVRRALPNGKRKMVGPWIFFDHVGPASFVAGEGVNVRPHPHINLATVTYLFEGEILHRDSLGSVQAIRPGDINLMVAGSGIVHSERESAEVNRVPHKIHGLQLWMALPQADEEMDAAFYHYPNAGLPAITVTGVPVRVMIGSAYGVNSPVKVFADTLYLEAHLEAGQSITLPAAEERAMYVVGGEMKLREMHVSEHTMAIFSGQGEIVVEATRASRIAIIGGEKFPERYIEWNFVSSRRSRIEQAKLDWREARFARVPGDEVEFIPLPD